MTGLEARQSTEANSALIGNLQMVVDAHQQGLKDIGYSEEPIIGYAAESGIEQLGVHIARSTKVILGKYGLTIGELRGFVGKGLVVDLGAGRSELLTSFRGSETIAVDLNEANLAFQSLKGHRAIKSNTVSIPEIKDESSMLTVAHMSVPLWLTSLIDATSSAHEMTRITKADGAMLVGPIGDFKTHDYYESFLSAILNGRNLMLWDQKGVDVRVASAPMVFMTEMLKLAASGQRKIVAVRSWEGKAPDPRNDSVELQVPNYFIIK